MNTRLQQFLAAENLSQSQLADTIGVARASISHIVAGRNKPGFDFIESLSRHFPALNLEWLITGKGKMYSDGSKREIPAELPLFEPVDSPAQDYRSETITPAKLQTASRSGSTAAKVAKIIVFYEDGTFQEFK